METLHEEAEQSEIEVTSQEIKPEFEGNTVSVKNITDGLGKKVDSDVDQTLGPDMTVQRASFGGTENEQTKTETENTKAEVSSNHYKDTNAVTIPGNLVSLHRHVKHEPHPENRDDDNNTEETEEPQKTTDVLKELPHKCAMLIPIPEPDYSDLADRDTLFPRPVITNPKTTYELACKQLGAVPISQYLRSLDTCAEDLRLQSHGLTRLDMLPLCHSLAYNTTATSLNLSQNRLLESVLPNIQAMMNDNSFIGSIDLSRNNLTGCGLRSLQVMLSNNYTLTSLNLSHCRLLDSDAPALAAVIEVSLNLRSLTLAHNELSECGKLLGDVLAEDEGLETLDLSWNTLRSKSAKELLLGMRKNSRLRRLDLSWNSLGPDTAVALRELLKKNTSLSELDVSHNRLNDNSVKPIGLGLTKNHTLEKLWIGHNPVTPVGALAVMRALPKASTNLVDLSQIEVSSDFVKLKDKLDSESITVIHGIVNKDMVLIVPAPKKRRR